MGRSIVSDSRSQLRDRATGALMPSRGHAGGGLRHKLPGGAKRAAETLIWLTLGGVQPYFPRHAERYTADRRVSDRGNRRGPVDTAASWIYALSTEAGLAVAGVLREAGPWLDIG